MKQTNKDLSRLFSKTAPKKWGRARVPGRKTDVKDAEWIADLLCHGLLRSSFVPPKPIRELRDLTRYRRKLVESQTAERNRLLKLLETANIKLASVATDVFGVSGRLMLEALVEGKATPQEMAELAKGRLRQKIDELGPALEGKLKEHHRFLLRLQLDRLEAAEKDLAVLEQRLQEKLKPYAEQLTLLDEIPGVDWTLAAVIIAELSFQQRTATSPFAPTVIFGRCGPTMLFSIGSSKPKPIRFATTARGIVAE